ncbi:hypothetical protein JHW43_007373 [Diplocarpon mali]|nr:hypothetical protein JHW43_007373 [Diplocarpon mali]
MPDCLPSMRVHTDEETRHCRSASGGLAPKARPPPPSTYAIRPGHPKHGAPPAPGVRWDDRYLESDGPRRQEREGTPARPHRTTAARLGLQTLKRPPWARGVMRRDDGRRAERRPSSPAGNVCDSQAAVERSGKAWRGVELSRVERRQANLHAPPSGSGSTGGSQHQHQQHGRGRSTGYRRGARGSLRESALGGTNVQSTRQYTRASSVRHLPAACRPTLQRQTPGHMGTQRGGPSRGGRLPTSHDDAIWVISDRSRFEPSRAPAAAALKAVQGSTDAKRPVVRRGGWSTGGSGVGVGVGVGLTPLHCRVSSARRLAARGGGGKEKCRRGKGWEDTRSLAKSSRGERWKEESRPRRRLAAGRGSTPAESVQESHCLLWTGTEWRFRGREVERSVVRRVGPITNPQITSPIHTAYKSTTRTLRRLSRSESIPRETQAGTSTPPRCPGSRPEKRCGEGLAWMLCCARRCSALGSLAGLLCAALLTLLSSALLSPALRYQLSATFPYSTPLDSPRLPSTPLDSPRRHSARLAFSLLPPLPSPPPRPSGLQVPRSAARTLARLPPGPGTKRPPVQQPAEGRAEGRGSPSGRRLRGAGGARAVSNAVEGCRGRLAAGRAREILLPPVPVAVAVPGAVGLRASSSSLLSPSPSPGQPTSPRDSSSACPVHAAGEHPCVGGADSCPLPSTRQRPVKKKLACASRSFGMAKMQTPARPSAAVAVLTSAPKGGQGRATGGKISESAAQLLGQCGQSDMSHRGPCWQLSIHGRPALSLGLGDGREEIGPGVMRRPRTVGCVPAAFRLRDISPVSETLPPRPTLQDPVGTSVTRLDIGSGSGSSSSTVNGSPLHRVSGPRSTTLSTCQPSHIDPPPPPNMLLIVDMMAEDPQAHIASTRSLENVSTRESIGPSGVWCTQDPGSVRMFRSSLMSIRAGGARRRSTRSERICYARWFFCLL